MENGCSLSERDLARLRGVAREEPRLAAIYIVGEPRPSRGCDLAVLLTEVLPPSDRVDLELAIGDALTVGRIELIDLRRRSLVFRFGVVDRGDLIYVGQPDALATFIEETLARYAAFYPLLEALYWKVETRPLAEDKL
ncbi:hypothetical protein ACFLWA_11585 [Chloroflexota bacterium]